MVHGAQFKMGVYFMLENWNKPQKPDDAELEERLKVAREKLAGQQMKIKEHGLPVLVLFEGW